MAKAKASLAARIFALFETIESDDLRGELLAQVRERFGKPRAGVPKAATGRRRRKATGAAATGATPIPAPTTTTTAPRAANWLPPSET